MSSALSAVTNACNRRRAQLLGAFPQVDGRDKRTRVAFSECSSPPVPSRGSERRHFACTSRCGSANHVAKCHARSVQQHCSHRPAGGRLSGSRTGRRPANLPARLGGSAHRLEGSRLRSKRVDRRCDCPLHLLPLATTRTITGGRQGNLGSAGPPLKRRASSEPQNILANRAIATSAVATLAIAPRDGP